MTGCALKKTRTTDHGTAFAICGPKHNPTNARMADRTGAHGAGLKRYHKG